MLKKAIAERDDAAPEAEENAEQQKGAGGDATSANNQAGAEGKGARTKAVPKVKAKAGAKKRAPDAGTPPATAPR